MIATVIETEARPMTEYGPASRFHLVLIKPSHYDDGGYVIQWHRSSIPTIAMLPSLTPELQEAMDLGIALYAGEAEDRARRPAAGRTRGHAQAAVQPHGEVAEHCRRADTAAAGRRDRTPAFTMEFAVKQARMAVVLARLLLLSHRLMRDPEAAMYCDLALAR